jgi:hypothetical protein
MVSSWTDSVRRATTTGHDWSELDPAGIHASARHDCCPGLVVLVKAQSLDLLTHCRAGLEQQQAPQVRDRPGEGCVSTVRNSRSARVFLVVWHRASAVASVAGPSSSVVGETEWARSTSHACWPGSFPAAVWSHLTPPTTSCPSGIRRGRSSLPSSTHSSLHRSTHGDARPWAQGGPAGRTSVECSGR